MIKHYSLTISGRVQQVGFRFFAMQMAYKNHINGFVRNQKGGVFIEAEGEEEELKRFMEWCHRGPESARVDNVVIKEGDVRNYSSFDIL